VLFQRKISRVTCRCWYTLSNV